jgi:NAD(P)-dependent dehydrogenase (short-subunit alcohol dehydrogenase family)
VGGTAQVAVVDALDEAAVDAHVDDVVARAGSVDVSFNLISRGDLQGTPLVEMTTNDLLRAPITGLRSNFLTSRAAARRMIAQRSGVILHLNSASGDASMPGMGSTGPTDAAVESFMRYSPRRWDRAACACVASGPPASRRRWRPTSWPRSTRTRRIRTP